MKKIIVISEDNEPFIPPFMTDYSKKEEEWIDRFWKWSGYKYIVDPLGYDQCVALEYAEMDSFYKFWFNLFFRIKTQIITYQEYKDGKWK